MLGWRTGISSLERHRNLEGDLSSGQQQQQHHRNMEPSVSPSHPAFSIQRQLLGRSFPSRSPRACDRAPGSLKKGIGATLKAPTNPLETVFPPNLKLGRKPGFVFVSSYLGLLEDMWSFVTATLLLTDNGWAQRFGALSFTTSKRHASKQNVTHVPHMGASPSSSKALEPDYCVATEAWQASHAFRLDAQLEDDSHMHHYPASAAPAILGVIQVVAASWASRLLTRLELAVLFLDGSAKLAAR